jgi:hypothetical protein
MPFRWSGSDGVVLALRRTTGRVSTTRVTAPAGADAAGPGIVVTAGDRLVILFSTAKTDGLATISLTDDSDVEVWTLHGQASFTSDLDRLRRVALVEVQVEGRRVFLKEGDRVVTQARPDPRGDYLIPLTW